MKFQAIWGPYSRPRVLKVSFAHHDVHHVYGVQGMGYRDGAQGMGHGARGRGIGYRVVWYFPQKIMG